MITVMSARGRRRLPEAGEGQQPRKSEYKVESLYSYGDGPRSWQALVDDPSQYKPDYFNCRSNTVTTRDKSDLSAIYYPRAFTENKFAKTVLEYGVHIWRFEVRFPPHDPVPSFVEKENGSDFHACDAGGGSGRKYVYNAYGWIIMHRAKGSSGAWQPLRKDTAGTTDLSDGSIVFFQPSHFADLKKVVVSHSNTDRPTELFQLYRLWKGKVPVENPKDCIYLVVNVNLLEPAYASIRSHEFVVVGVTRGDPEGELA